mgnify:CR=1 FL=1
MALNLIAYLHNSVIEVTSAKEWYNVTYWHNAKKKNEKGQDLCFELNHSDSNKKETYILPNANKDKWKSIEEMTALLQHGIIKVIKEQSLQTKQVTEFNL